LAWWVFSRGLQQQRMVAQYGKVGTV
jgi:hypothetical protein